MFLFAAVFRLAGAPELPKIKYSIGKEEAAIKETGKVLEMRAGSLKLAPGSAAQQLAVPGKIYRWTPSVLNSRATGGADLYSSALTADNTAAVLAERVGGAGESHGLRLIVCETVSGNIVRATGVFPVRPFCSRVMEDNTFLALVHPAPLEDTSCRFAVIDIASGKLNLMKELPASPLAAAISGKFAAVLGNDGKLSVYSTSDFSQLCSREVGAGFKGVAFSNDGKLLAVFGSGKVTVYTAETLYRRAGYKIDGADFTRCTVPGKNSFENAVFYTPDGDACVLINHNLIKLDIIPGGAAAADLQSGRVIIENRIRELEIFQFPDLLPTAKYSPGKMRPASRNEIFALGFIYGKKDSRLLLTDHRGNLWLVEFKGKRGRKTALLIADKTGVRQSK